MLQTMFRRAVIPVFMLIVAAGCSGDANDSDVSRLSLRMKAVSVKSMISGRAAHGTYEFTAVRLGLSSFEFETQYEDEMEDYHGMSAGNPEEFSGEYQVDLISGMASPAFGEVQGYAGEYEKVSMKLAPVLPGGNSVYFEFLHNGNTVRFSTPSDQELEIEADTIFKVEDQGIVKWLVVLDLDDLFDGIMLDDLLPNQQGVIEISDAVNTDLAEILLTRLAGAMKCGKDNNGDDFLDD